MATRAHQDRVEIKECVQVPMALLTLASASKNFLENAARSRIKHVKTTLVKTACAEKTLSGIFIVTARLGTMGSIASKTMTIVYRRHAKTQRCVSIR